MSAVAKAVSEVLPQIDTSGWTYIRTVHSTRYGNSSDIYKEGRQCSLCEILKPWDEFNKHSNGVNKKGPWCKSCNNTHYRAKNYPRQKEGTIVCDVCDVEKDVSEFATKKTVLNGLNAFCKSCANANLRAKNYPRQKKGTKICSVCDVEKDVSEFSTNKIVLDGLTSWCKGCVNTQAKSKSNPRRTEGTKTCNGCDIEKEVSEFGTEKRARDGLNSLCLPCANKSVKKAIANHPENHTSKEARIRHKESTAKTIANNPEKYIPIEVCRRLTQTLINKGLAPKAQSKCTNPACTSTKPLEKHHDNHMKPWEFVTLCKVCHGKIGEAGTGGTVDGYNFQDLLKLEKPKRRYKRISDKTINSRISSKYHNRSYKFRRNKYWRREAMVIFKILYPKAICELCPSDEDIEHHHDQGYATREDILTTKPLCHDCHQEVTYQFNNSIAKLEFKRAKWK